MGMRRYFGVTQRPDAMLRSEKIHEPVTGALVAGLF